MAPNEIRHAACADQAHAPPVCLFEATTLHVSRRVLGATAPSQCVPAVSRRASTPTLSGPSSHKTAGTGSKSSLAVSTTRAQLSPHEHPSDAAFHGRGIAHQVPAELEEHFPKKGVRRF
jgi:hypothetical protein